MIISKEEYFNRAKKLYGENPLDWKFTCTGCGKTQSGQSVIDKSKKGEISARQGTLKKGDSLYPDCECYGTKCNWVAYGLFNSNILVIHDPTKPHNESIKENCSYHFPLADDEEMLKESGVKKHV